jgi:diguanylate cyclase (GGDEF)-like protein/PAS domain S-box-containing protein
MKENSCHSKNELPTDYLEILYRRHFQGALVRSGASMAMWLFALAAYHANVIKLNHFAGITLSILYLILINPPTLLLLKHIIQVRLYKYGSLLINFLEILGYTAIIYFMGGIEATFLTPIYAALITYVAVIAPRSFPFIIAFLCSAAFSFVVISEYFGLLPRQSIVPSFDPPWLIRLTYLSVVIGLLLVVAYIGSLTSSILKKNRNRLREQNVELMDAIDRLRRESREREQAEVALRESEERYRTLVENASDMIYRTDENGYFTFANPAGLRITGYKEDEIIGKHYKMMVRPDMFKEAITFFANQLIKKIQNTYYEYPIIAKDGHELWIGQNMQLIMEEDHVTGFQSVARDITERKRIEEALRDSENRYRELSIVDDLTQLYNSRHFYHQLRMEIDRVERYGQPLTLLLLDLDDFKRFNDAYGHVEGDQVLSRLGQVVKRCLRQTDSAYRYGGEEFTILLPMTKSEDGVVTADRIRTEFKKELFSPAPGQDVHVTVSIGLGQYKTKEEMKAFVHRIDQLMYQGKKNGKDRVCSEP